jgi:hypothetical protein
MLHCPVFGFSGVMVKVGRREAAMGLSRPLEPSGPVPGGCRGCWAVRGAGTAAATATVCSGRLQRQKHTRISRTMATTTTTPTMLPRDHEVVSPL